MYSLEVMRGSTSPCGERLRVAGVLIAAESDVELRGTDV